MSLKRIFSDKVRKCRPEEVGIALILAALAAFGFSRTSVLAEEIAGKPVTTDAITTPIHEQLEKINTSEKKHTEETLKSSFKSSAAAALGSSASSSSAKTHTAAAGGAFVTINGVDIPMFAAMDTTVNPGSRAALYGRLLYGHRGTAFGAISSLPIGAQFTITRNGATETSVVVNSTTLDRDTTARFMYALTSSASFKGQTYSLTLMTCAGAPGDNGDASHRSIVFANRI